MSTTITKATVTITPLEVLGYQSVRKTGNLLHQVIGRNDVDVTFKAAGLRSGTISMLFPTQAAALQCEALYASPGIAVLADTDIPGIGMAHVPSGDITVTLDDESRALWTVDVQFQEVVL